MLRTSRCVRNLTDHTPAMVACRERQGGANARLRPRCRRVDALTPLKAGFSRAPPHSRGISTNHSGVIFPPRGWACLDWPSSLQAEECSVSTFFGVKASIRRPLGCVSLIERYLNGLAPLHPLVSRIASLFVSRPLSARRHAFPISFPFFSFFLFPFSLRSRKTSRRLPFQHT